MSLLPVAPFLLPISFLVGTPSRKIAKAASHKEKFQLASDVRNDKRTEVLRRAGSSSRAANISGPRPKGHARYRPGRTLPRSHQIPESCRQAQRRPVPGGLYVSAYRRGGRWFEVSF